MIPIESKQGSEATAMPERRHENGTICESPWDCAEDTMAIDGTGEVRDA